MKRIYILLILAAAFVTCNKTSDNIIWEKSFGPGKAVFVTATGDTGFVSCGEVQGKKYLIYINADYNTVTEYASDDEGVLTSVILSEGTFIAAGSTGHKMTVLKIDVSGTVLWERVFDTPYAVDRTNIIDLGSGEYLAIGSADPDSVAAVPAGITYVWFNADATVRDQINNESASFVAVSNVKKDDSGNFYFSFTRSATGEKKKSTVAKYNSALQKIWEKELYNNPSLASAGLDLELDDENNPLVVGKTEIQVNTGADNNAFAARYIFSDDSLTKKYLEYSNAATSVVSDGAGQFMVLNSKCLIVNILDQDLEVTGSIRTYSVCDPSSTDIYGYSISLTPDGYIIMAGERSGNYYLVVKPSPDGTPV